MISNVKELLEAAKTEQTGEIITFGKYKDKKLSEVPEEYISWCKENYTEKNKRTFEVKPGVQETLVSQEPVDQKNSFKLTRNSKGVNWEFKILEDDLEILKTKVLEMRAWVEENFGRDIK